MIAVDVELCGDGQVGDRSIAILVTFDMKEGCFNGVLLEKMDASVGHVVIIGCSDSRVKVCVCFPFVHSSDEGFVIAVKLNGGKRCPIRDDVFDGDMEERTGREGEEHAGGFGTEGGEFG